MSSEGPTPQELALAKALAADAAGAEVVGALRREGIEPILLKGPTLAGWLYPGELRPYGDTDLLVDPGAIWRAAAVLEHLGFRPVAEHVALHSHPWTRERDGANIDLHVNLWGAYRRPELVWAELQRWTEPARIAGETVNALNRPARALYAALHAAQHAGDEIDKPQEDLRRALERTPEVDWRAADRLADRVSALPRMVIALERQPAGRRLLERLPLAQASRLADRGDAPLAIGFARWREARGIRARTSVVLGSLTRPPGEWTGMTATTAGGAGLLARGRHLAWLIRAAARTVVALGRARGR